MLLLFKFIFLGGGVIPLFLGLFIFFQDRKKIINITYLGLSLCCAIWSIGFFSLLSSKTFEIAYLARTFMDIGAIILPAFWLHFVFSVLEIKKSRFEIVLLYSIGIFISILNILDYIMPGIFISNLKQIGIFQFYPSASIGYYLFALFYLIIIPYSLYYLIKNRGDGYSLKSQQIKFLLIAAIFGFGGGTTAFFYTFNLSIPPYGMPLFVLYPLIVGYAITKLRLFNIKVVATEMLVGGLILFLVVRSFISESTQEQIINGVLATIVSIFGILLIGSVLKEVRQREEIERLAKDLSSANARLKELDKLKSEFVSIASHQLRSPLTAIKGYASLIKDGSFGKVSPGVGEAIDKIFQSSQSLVAMVEDFLNISRIEQGRMKFEFESFDLKTLAVEIIGELKPTVERAGLTLSLSTDHQEPYAIKADHNKIRQIINNLIDNAIKYTPKGSISVTLSRRPNRKKILIAIADTGIGIDAETIPHLFEKFSRAKDANKVNVIGTGLGLYIVKEIVSGHHGRVWVESSGKGTGSTFYVELDEDSTVIHATRIADFAKTM